uniref:Uncharacterized protein n=1 Tax=Chenopodium quinoa TaxID=63459 RepID=A0A803N9N7_CHEQI
MKDEEGGDYSNSDRKRARRRFEDDESNGRVKEEKAKVMKDEEGGGGHDGGDYSNKDRKRARRRFEDGETVAEPSNRSGSRPNVMIIDVCLELEVMHCRKLQLNILDRAEESLNVSSRFASESFSANNHTATKVSSISTTNENKGVNITGSHEVTGKSSTDGTPSTAGKSGNFFLDALAKAKKALQMHKHKKIAEKTKKTPSSNKEESKSSNAAGIQQTPPDVPPASSSAKTVGMIDPAKYEAVKRAQELAAKMGFRQDTEFAPLINLFPGKLPPDAAALQKPAKAPVLRLDAFGREVDEHGNVVNISKPSSLSTLKVNINKQKKDAFQIHKPELEVDPEKNPHFDPRMGIDKTKLLRPKRMSFQFVEEGKWSKDAEIIKLKSQFGEAQAKEHKAKQAQLAKAKAEPNINPNLIEVSERVITKEKPKESIPEVEWWDVPLLRSGDYADIADGSTIEDRVKMEKITMYVEHPRPIEPPAEPAPPQPQPLKLTKKEQKKLRTQRRLAKEKERQEMIRQGLIEPPKPKVKMSNLMKVLGSEATQDPTKLEMEIRTAAAEREQAHVDRNIARKLTPAERREKKERKLFDDPNTLETIVSVYKINDLSHPKNRFKVDINAQENRLTGCAVISEGFSVVVVEGGSKSIQRTEAAARKVFFDAGVGHYWELAANFVDDQI